MLVSDSGCGGTFEQAPIGAHAGRCIGLIDIGTHHGEYEGVPNKRRQVIVRWELPDELMETGEFAGKPFTVSEFYTLSLNEKAKLRGVLTSWRGKPFTDDELRGFDVKTVLGAPCMVQVGRNAKEKAKVLAVMSKPKSTVVPPQVNPSVYFSFDEFDQSVYDGFSDGIKGLIQKSDEWAARSGAPSQSDEQQAADFSDADVPF